LIHCHDCHTPNWSGVENCRRCGADLYGRRQESRPRRTHWLQSLLSNFALW